MPLEHFEIVQGWQAQWIWHPEATRDGYAVVLFRKTLDLPHEVEDPTLWITADERFVFYLDGNLLARGPTRSDPTRWPCARVRPGTLAAGRHTLAAAAFHFGPDHAGMGQLSCRAGFLLRGEAPQGGEAFDARVRTDASWRCFQDLSRGPVAPEWGDLRIYYCAGDGERIDGARAPWGWMGPDFDDRDWRAPVELCPGVVWGQRQPRANHWLVPDPLPPMDEDEERFARVAETDHPEPEALDAWLREDRAVQVAAHSKVRILLDRGLLTNAYTPLTVSGGQGAAIRAVNVEALYLDGKLNKGDRNQTAGKHAWGQVDEFLPGGGERETFETLWWRSYRYLELTVTTGDRPLTLDKIRSRFTGYPLRERGGFTPDEPHRPSFAKMLDLGWRTARLCAHETYFDCPHFEQLQYIGDTRVQALFSYLLAGDDRLARKSIDDFWHSRIPEGLTQSRFPTRLRQVIPPFSLYWIGMLYDFFLYRGDKAFLEPYLPAAREILAWFLRRRREDGLIGPLPHWNFTDWVPAWKHGESPGNSTGGSAYLALLVAQAARWLSKLEWEFDYPDLSRRWKTVADTLGADVVRECWDAERRMLSDQPRSSSFSQHANVQGILEGALGRYDTRELLQRILRDPGVTPPGSPYFRFYVAQAMKAVGWRAGFFELLKHWEGLLEGTGLTTWPESDGRTRSDCHAWSCTPSIEFLQTVLGVEPDLEIGGFRRAVITPCLGPLNEAAGEVPTPHGSIRLELQRLERGAVRARVETPVSAKLVEEASGRLHPLSPGFNEVVFMEV
ncbi:MAG: hypothetical protein M5U26_26965 [Planctomycetota bacterium]|nr:hypothetical protein [Planctomycetota bacterium]